MPWSPHKGSATRSRSAPRPGLTCFSWQSKRYVINVSVADNQPDVLYTKVLEIDERVAPEWEDFGEGESVPKTYSEMGTLEHGINGAKMRLLRPLGALISRRSERTS